MSTSFPCYLVTRSDSGEVQARMSEQDLDSLPAGEVLIRVHWSSLNYKDALAASGHPGVVRKFPHVPGIDAAGYVEQSSDDRYRPGDPVLCTSYELGAGQWGGWARYLRVPADWVLRLPDELSFEQAMAYGTAGLTAGLSLLTLQEHDLEPSSGEVVVTGATGGVGSLSVMLLAEQGYQVAAVTGKQQYAMRLQDWGARSILQREEVLDSSSKPLLPSRWAGAIDTVGGPVLATILRQTAPRGCVAACGLVGGTDLPLTVYPFLLRGITLAGIDSAHCSRERRAVVWQQLASTWRLTRLDELVTTVPLEEVATYVDRILQGQQFGRVLLRIP